MFDLPREIFFFWKTTVRAVFSCGATAIRLAQLRHTHTHGQTSVRPPPDLGFLEAVREGTGANAKLGHPLNDTTAVRSTSRQKDENNLRQKKGKHGIPRDSIARPLIDLPQALPLGH